MSVSDRKLYGEPLENKYIPLYFRKNNQLKSRTDFEKVLFPLWQQAVGRFSRVEERKIYLPLEKLPMPTGECKNPYLEKVTRQAWDEYQIMCDFFSRNAVFDWSDRSGKITSEEFIQLKFENIMVACCPNLYFPLLLLDSSGLKKLISDNNSLLKQMNFSD